ncbi:MAG: ParB/RepB/Spo0J family partition protein [Anaerolineaceae bacterium]
MSESFVFLNLDHIRPNPDQPRLNFDEGEIQSLARSIGEIGVLNPIVVRGPFSDESGTHYFLIDGERRWRASRMAGLSVIPAYIRDGVGGDGLQLALIANLQRSDMNPIEEAMAYQRLLDEGNSPKEIAELVGRSIPTISLKLKLLHFEPEIQRFYAQGLLPIDVMSIAAISDLPDELRVRLTARMAANHSTGSAIRAICSRVIHNSYRGNSQRLDIQKSNPAVTISKVKETPSLKALGDKGAFPNWTLITTGAEEACRDCVYGDEASTALCKDCPLIFFLKSILRNSGE